MNIPNGTVIMTCERIENGPPVITHNADGTLTRKGAVIEIRKLYGDLGTISSDEQLPRFVWCIGLFGLTVGRGKTWELALKQAQSRYERNKEKIKELLKREKLV